jgi:hypothetical protein
MVGKKPRKGEKSRRRNHKKYHKEKRTKEVFYVVERRRG